MYRPWRVATTTILAPFEAQVVQQDPIRIVLQAIVEVVRGITLARGAEPRSQDLVA